MSDSDRSSDSEVNIVIRTETENVGVRGPTTMRELVRTKNFGEKLHVEFNDQGQPVGENSAKMQSFIGMCVRQEVPITYNQWREVPREFKDKIFDSVKSLFVVSSRYKYQILQSAAKKFRTFKSTLTQKYILPFKDESSCLQTPPKKYAHLNQEHWKAFVNSRLTEEWETLSSAQRERRAQSVYNHRISRKGYANLAKELELSDDPTNRATLWKEARKGKDNEYCDEATKKRARRIDELAEKHKGQDILTEALGTPEHRGHVRGVGGYVTPSLYFNALREKSKSILQSEERVKTRSSQSKKSVVDKNNVSKKKSRGKEVGNAQESENNVSKKKLKRKEVVNAPESENNVSKKRLKGKEVLSAPESEENLEVVRSLAISNTITQSSNYTDVHVVIKLLNRYAMISMQVEDKIQINLGDHIFKNEKAIFLHRDDIMLYCGMNDIGYSCILTYIAYLWDVCDHEITKKFMIVDQATMSTEVKFKEHRSRNLANSLEMVGLNQLVLIPYNTGCYWMLIVIHPGENTVYILDSMRNKIEKELRGVVNKSLKMWQAKHSLEDNSSTTSWNLIRCPRQLSSVESGYCVQKYIREIVHNSNTPISNLFNTESAFKQEELDAIRIEWAGFVGRFI